LIIVPATVFSTKEEKEFNYEVIEGIFIGLSPEHLEIDESKITN
jgi:hypothetical protein